MRTLILLALLLVTPATVWAEETAQVQEEDLDVRPEWLRKPSSDDLQAVWPIEALRDGVGGRAVLDCQVSPQGALEGCTVREEAPEGMGFGAAALLLKPSLVLKPGMKNGKPVRTSVQIPIRFEASEPIGAAWLERTSMVSDPVWEQAPTFADMAAAWPKDATAEFGHVSMRCGIELDGRLEHCSVLTEAPSGQGFGKAARAKVAPKFRMRMTPEIAQKVAKASVNLPVHFSNPAKAPPRLVVRPKWINRLDPQKVVEVYPDAAAEAGVKSGRGVAECTVAFDGKLVDCQPAPATPEGLGFSDAAVKVASVMRMNPWSDGGGPVDGVRLRLPVAFNLAPEDEVAAAPSAITYVKDVVWTRKPSGHDMAAVVPQDAIERGIDGRIILDCAVTPDGNMRDCGIAEEEPTGFGYGAAALKLASKFKMKAGSAPPAARVKIPIKIFAR